jgi:hypothetical protein
MKNPITEYFRLVRAIERAKREARAGDLLAAARANADIQKTMMRPRRYATTNGAGEIGWGLAMLCFTLSSYATVILPPSPWRGWVGYGFLAGACGVMPLSLWISRRFIIQSRVGYVVLRRDTAWWTGVAVSAVVAAAISIALSLWLIPEMFHAAPPPAHHTTAVTAHNTPSRSDVILVAAYGPANAILYLMMNTVSLKNHRWKWLCALLILGMPLVAGWQPGNFFEMSRPVTLCQGLVYLLSGTMTLHWFLQHHPSAGTDPE